MREPQRHNGHSAAEPQPTERGRPGRSGNTGAGVRRISGVVAGAEPLRAGRPRASILGAREGFSCHARPVPQFSTFPFHCPKFTCQTRLSPPKTAAPAARKRSEYSTPFSPSRAATGVRSRSAWGAAAPPRVHPVSVVRNLVRLDDCGQGDRSGEIYRWSARICGSLAEGPRFHFAAAGA